MLKINKNNNNNQNLKRWISRKLFFLISKKKYFIEKFDDLKKIFCILNSKVNKKNNYFFIINKQIGHVKWVSKFSGIFVINNS